jgi:hypothetical protein
MKEGRGYKRCNHVVCHQGKEKESGDKMALSAQQVADKVNKQQGTSVTRFTITRHVKEGRIGE